MGGAPIAKDWLVSIVLLNGKTCMVGNQVSRRLACTPLTLEEYFGSRQIRRTTVPRDPMLPESGVDSEDLALEEAMITDRQEETEIELALNI